ncbi:unnamed protein product [Closterium sp. Naga37s-1]|nr:unnamed protein product [Closterium sp. Naga37s-1]
MVRAINNAGPGYVAPRRNYVGGAGLKLCRTGIEKGLQPIAASWKRDGVTVSSDLMTDRADCKELMADWPHIEYVPCATHVRDLLMEDRCGDMITYVHNHHFTRNYLRTGAVKGGKGKHLVKPAGTRFGTNFIALSRLCQLRPTLSQMVLREEYANWGMGTSKLAADTFRGHVMDDEWWTKATYLVELLALPFKVMRATDSNAKGMMGTIYDLMLQLT